MSNRKNMDLYAVASDLLEGSLHDDWRPNTPEIIAHYDLTEQQATTVKRYTKRLAANREIMWGWHPESEAFRVAPTENAPHIAYSMIEYTYYHVALQTRDLDHLFPGAVANRYITEESAKKARRANTAIAKKLRAIFESIEFYD